jgi:hypothetical protein
MSERRIVKNFLPEQNGFHFSNWFADVPLEFKVAGIDLHVGSARNGVCGGMIYAACDLFYSAKLPPPEKSAPDNGILFKYLCQRLLESFALPFGPLLYYYWMNPAVRDAVESPGAIFKSIRSRAWKMIRIEWKKIKQEIDQDRLAPIGIILAKSWKPADLGKNHQVLVYGYELDGDMAKLLIYDPNAPDNNDASISLRIADPYHKIEGIYAHSGRKVANLYCFFMTRYRYKNPG